MPLGRTAKEKVKVSNVQVAVRASGDLGRDPDRVDHVVPASPTFGEKNNADISTVNVYSSCGGLRSACYKQ